MLYEEVRRNKRKTFGLLFVVALFFSLVGAAIGYIEFNSPWEGIFFALIVGGVITTFTVFQSSRMILAQAGAQELFEDDAPNLYHMVQDLAMVAQIPMPRLYLIQDPTPNAFATGLSPKKAAVSVTTGLVQMLNREELEGVIGHEMTHIRHYDVRTMTILLGLSTAVSYMTQYMFFRNNDNRGSNVFTLVMFLISLVLSLISAFIMSLLQMAVSRRQEYSADAGAVELTRNPQGLIKALEKIEQLPPSEVANKQLAAIYFGKVDSKKWFSTHPATKDRIAALRQL